MHIRYMYTFIVVLHVADAVFADHDNILIPLPVVMLKTTITKGIAHLAIRVG